jgi:hypothetical protein
VGQHTYHFVPGSTIQEFVLQRSTFQWLTVRVNESVRLRPPDAPAIVSVAFVAGAVPPPHPVASNHVAMNIPKPTVAATRTGRMCDRLISRVNIDPSTKSDANAATAAGNLEALGP